MRVSVETTVRVRATPDRWRAGRPGGLRSLTEAPSRRRASNVSACRVSVPEKSLCRSCSSGLAQGVGKRCWAR